MDVVMKSKLSWPALGLAVVLTLAIVAVIKTSISTKPVAQTATEKMGSEPAATIATPDPPPGMRRVVETKTKLVNYSVARPVRETHEKEVTYTVMKPIYETREKTVTYTVCTMVPEVKTKTISYTTCRIEHETKQKAVEYDEVRYVPIEDEQPLTK